MENLEIKIERFIIYPTNIDKESQVVLGETAYGDHSFLISLLEAKKARDNRNNFSYFYKITNFETQKVSFDYYLNDEEFKIANKYFKLK